MQLLRTLPKLRQAVIAFYYFHESDEREKMVHFVNPVIPHTSETNNIKPVVLKSVTINCALDSVPHINPSMSVWLILFTPLFFFPPSHSPS